jgi:hypothetical protein
MSRCKTVQELRKMLKGVTWSAFIDKDINLLVPCKSKAKIKGVTFYAKFGLHMQRPVLAIVAQGHFISLLQVHYDNARIRQLPVTADSNYRNGDSAYLYKADFAPSSLALHYLIDGAELEITDLVIKELDHDTAQDTPR